MAIIQITREKMNSNWLLFHKEKDIKIKTSLPNSMFVDLLKNKMIQDPFYGENEHDVNWVYNSDWVMIKKFSLDDSDLELLQKEYIYLIFKGIDALSDVYLNDNHLGHTENMFQRYIFNVKPFLKKENNELKVILNSPTKFAQSEIEKYGIKLNTGGHAIPGVPYLRKSQYSFGWDWGPKLPDIGIWKEIELIGYDLVRIDNIQHIQGINFIDTVKDVHINKNYSDIKANECNIKFNVNLGSDLSIEQMKNENLTLKIEIKDKNGDKVADDEIQISNTTPELELLIKEPKLWWTHDLGEPYLYNATISIIKNGSSIDVKALTIGIRKIELIREKDKWGESFYFLLNNVPLWAKGANWIPVDSFIPRGKNLDLYRGNLAYALEANMNMIRVWGGGIYEDDSFYEICDELGILVWQDFPFACAVYPPEAEFNKKVREEAIDNIIRLRNHPSLALWCGNNEIEQGYPWYSRPIKNPITRSKFKEGYIERFERLLPSLVQGYDPTRPYWPSSPSNGGFLTNNSGILKSNSADFGDSHFWKVWHGGAPFSEYRKFDSRFMSEFGFESFPSMKTIAEFCPLTSENLKFDSAIMENHQKNRAGNKKIMQYMKKRYSIPKSFEKQVILSQITHAEAMEYGIEHWRRNRNDFHCMGSLYWQLNDCWPVASWASLDYYLRWKALHYFARRVYLPLFASVSESRNNTEFWITNDLKIIKSGQLEWKICDKNNTALLDGKYDFKIDPCSSLMLKSIDTTDINKKKKNMRNNIIFYELYDENNKLLLKGARLFDHPKRFSLKNPQINWKLVELDGLDYSDCVNYGKALNGYIQNQKERKNYSIFKITIKANEIALYVHIVSDKHDFVASDNFFPMEKNEEISVLLITDSNIDKIEFEQSISIGSLYNLVK